MVRGGFGRRDVVVSGRRPPPQRKADFAVARNSFRTVENDYEHEQSKNAVANPGRRGEAGILGIDLALRHKDRVGKAFAFAANTVVSGVKEGVEKNPTFAAFIERAGHEYAEHSATPKEYDAFVDQISKMWFDQPNWTDAELKAVDRPILVVDGDHDEAIKREHTEYIAATIPHAGLLILPNVSHFAFLQDPKMFTFAILHFLGDE